MDRQELPLADNHRVLIVANKTALGKPLIDAVEAILAKGPASFVVLVPSTEPEEGTFTWDETAAWASAEARAIEVVTALSEMGAEASGIVGDRAPVDAVRDLLEASPPFQEIIVSTLPLGISRWLGFDLPNRVRQLSGVPVTHVVFDPRHPMPVSETETHPDWDRPVNRPLG